jgi:hypothetical protein
MKIRSYIAGISVKLLFLLSCIEVILLVSCQEYYTDSNIDNGDEILVIEGLITNEPGPYKIKISNTLPYNQPGLQSSNSSPVRNADVSISDDKGNTEQLTENEPGIYYTSASGMHGENGRSYILHVLTYNGDRYQSEPCLMETPATIDTLYAEQAEVIVLEKTESGVYFETTYDGINVYMDAQPSPGKEFYYKIENRAIKEAFHLEWRNGRPVPGMRPPEATSVYCWYTTFLTIEKDLLSNSTTESPPIKKRMTGFINSYVVSQPNEINDPAYLFGVISTTTLYSLSKRIYEIYVQLNSQTKPENSIFDPIPTRIESNIACTNDPSRTVLGYFGAAAVARKTYYFNWNESGIKQKNVDSMPVLEYSEGCSDNIPPAFWINP